MLVRLAIQPCQRLSHYVELRLAVPFENLGIALTKHLCDEMIGNATGAEPGSEGVPKVVWRKLRDSGLS
jgi:hypothetical protein